ncbi:hypothetical protein EPUS_02831 [Endocarpon pusillum Z07020]|uniref:polynucleotide adenylyltransferase n=1 Tax=Endocarpon pusillum (strain Z07020 / HMAS-L-300199) TaxID=1263415 RepID=U1HTG1_ENDPU|nr:uncharacterized protein EPUS_02831 [Endocarpon pusillum Z07020]ERF72549.1 hypothetical protein EPUS_02831 [Endocarpon pusillum Z07020]
MAAAPVRQWGLTPAISSALPTPADVSLNSALIEELKRQNNYETTLQLLYKVTVEFVKEVCRKKGFSEASIAQFGGKIFPYGSYRLGVYGPGSDIDTLVVAPRQVKREDFFELFPTILKRMVPTKDIGDMTAVPDSFVPIIKMELCGIDIDLIFARIPTLNAIPLHLDLRDTKLLEGMDQAEIKSVNGTRVTDEILGLVPQPKTFRTALRAIKLWAQRRAIYANILGFPGGVAWAMLVARVCQLYPTATGSTIIQKFFFIIGQWSWPSPIMLKAIETGKEKTWNPQIYSGDKKNLMPVITPAYPSMCATFNISKSGKTIILKELKRGEEIVKKIVEGKSPWSALFDRHTFFTQDHRYYLNVISSSNNKDAALAWSGLVESKVRILVMKLEEQADMIELARPFIKGYERVHKVKSDAEADEVKKGSVKHQVLETKTTDETHEPARVVAAETGTVVGDAKNAHAETNGNNEVQTIYTTTFYVGIELTAAATKNLDISFAISFFKNTCTSWQNWQENLHEVNVVPIKCYDLPDDVFDKEKGDVKPTKPKKKAPLSKKAVNSTVQKRSFSDIEKLFYSTIHRNYCLWNEMRSMPSSQAERAMLVAPSKGSNQHRKYHGQYKAWLRWFFSDSWALEYLAMTIAGAALATIFTTLMLYNGKPLNSWPHSIQLNTVLSTLATIMKGFMLMPVCACLSQLKWLWYTRKTKSLQDFQIFDMASRGPWGALQLLFRLKFWQMASIGSIIILLSLASDAFLQQSVSYPLRVHPQSKNIASIPYAQHFNLYDSLAGPPYTTQPLIAAVYDGVFSRNLTRSASSITPYCPTGNCTFPEYASLAVCSNCHNVSSLLRVTHEPDQISGISKYSLPNGHSLTSESTIFGYLSINASTGPSTLRSNHLELNSDTLSKYQSPGTITNVSVITGGDPSEPWAYTAWDCVLAFCAKSYQASQSLSYFNETPLDVFEGLQSATFSLNSTDDLETFFFDVPSTYLTTIGSRNRTFSVNTPSLEALQDSLGTTLLGDTGRNEMGQFAFTNGIAQGFYNNGVKNVKTTFANIADALTNAMRVNSQEHVEGTVLVVEPFIQVQWLWLLYPFIVVTLSMVFLGLTVWRTRRSEVPSWRSSILAVMEHGVNSSIQEDTSSDLHNGINGDLATAAGKEKVGDLEVWAEEVSVRLRSRGLWGKGFGLTVT